MKYDKINCPSCHTQDIQLIGEIPATDRFAGCKLSGPLEGRRLYRCDACYLYFRYPRLSEIELNSLYARGSIYNWRTRPELRNDWRIAASWIRKNLSSGSKILDVGCFDGRFLELLGKGYRRFGIEIHEEARELARSRGIAMIESDLNGLDKIIGKYDAAIAIDVIEHVHDPYCFLANLSRTTREGGLIILCSGDTESLSWRMMRHRYYYCVLAEHISFINARWCQYASSRLGLELRCIQRFSHSRAGLLQCVSEFGKNMLYFLAPAVAQWFRSKGCGGKDVRAHKELLDHPPNWASARDHIAVVFKRS